MKYWLMAIVFLASLGVYTATAEETGSTDNEYILDDLIINAEPVFPETDKVKRSAIESGKYTNAGEVVAELPGVSAVRRSAGATEPVIRGQGWERVSTQINNLPAFGACPARMDPPITYIKPHSTHDVQVVKAVPSVTLGPAGTGGRIIINTDYERSSNAPEKWERWMRTGFDEGRQGISGEAGIQGGNKDIDFRAAIEALDYNDYKSAKGTRVPANQDGYSGSASFGWRPAENQRWWSSLGYVREEAVDYPSLPMNLDKTDFWVFNTGYRLGLSGGILKQMDAAFGLQDIEHLMSNRNKPNRGMFENETPSSSDAYSGLIKFQLAGGSQVDIIAGVDTSYLTRDAVRTRHVVATGQTFKDYIWPDATQFQFGGFAEATWLIRDDLSLRIGGRVDRVESEAKQADAPSLLMNSVRDNYVLFYGPDAGEVDQNETVGGGNLLLEWFFTDSWSAYVGGGISSRAAGITERYFAFAPAPGGYLIGNPNLEPEQKFEAVGGVGYDGEWWRFTFSLYHFWYKDYILQKAIGQQDINNDGTSDLIRGFENIDARFYGGETVLILRPFEHWEFPVSASYVRGKNKTDDKDLPEIPPFEATAAAIYKSGSKVPWWVEFGGRFVARQDKIDPSFPEDETASYTLFHLRSGVKLNRFLSMQAGIENLFNKEYNDHLTREALLPVGDLQKGDEIPGPGMRFYTNIKFTF